MFEFLRGRRSRQLRVGIDSPKETSFGEQTAAPHIPKADKKKPKWNCSDCRIHNCKSCGASFLAALKGQESKPEPKAVTADLAGKRKPEL